MAESHQSPSAIRSTQRKGPKIAISGIGHTSVLLRLGFSQLWCSGSSAVLVGETATLLQHRAPAPAVLRRPLDEPNHPSTIHHFEEENGAGADLDAQFARPEAREVGILRRAVLVPEVPAQLPGIGLFTDKQSNEQRSQARNGNPHLPMRIPPKAASDARETVCVFGGTRRKICLAQSANFVGKPATLAPDGAPAVARPDARLAVCIRSEVRHLARSGNCRQQIRARAGISRLLTRWLLQADA
jgi:hypothetical protein